jgi:hypothetical protein
MNSNQEALWIGKRFHQLVLDHGINLQEAMSQANREWKDFTASNWCFDYFKVHVDYGKPSGDSMSFSFFDVDERGNISSHIIIDDFQPLSKDEEWQDAVVLETLQLPEHVEIPEVQERRQSEIT